MHLAEGTCTSCNCVRYRRGRVVHFRIATMQPLYFAQRWYTTQQHQNCQSHVGMGSTGRPLSSADKRKSSRSRALSREPQASAACTVTLPRRAIEEQRLRGCPCALVGRRKNGPCWPGRTDRGKRRGARRGPQHSLGLRTYSTRRKEKVWKNLVSEVGHTK